MKTLSLCLTLSGVAILLGGGVYALRQAGYLQSERTVRACAMGVGFLFGSFATQAICLWLFESATWEWIRTILGPLGGAIAGYVAVRVSRTA